MEPNIEKCSMFMKRSEKKTNNGRNRTIKPRKSRALGEKKNNLLILGNIRR